ncbi:sulfatase-like hydrolase/transferase [Cytophaga sp. FL35]|uniref:sulfatase-like hydrolase/transferase n=1 Tax=Cytophaga sp. FL35 TaxID=1904456 RepID=UPI001653A9FA|nr:sulfatase-like hydrolase/transferase [Cytophaga sp. FL35]MBC6997085.1 sulfatase-like hydrolase/transferase [Cytophaga sp. FL35]
MAEIKVELRKRIFYGVKCQLILLVLIGQSLGAQDKPNIIVVLTDDQGWADVGFNGATDIPTPQLDALAKEGVVFENGYVSHPYCSPSRAGLLTGRYQARFGHDCNMPYDDENDASVGTPLKEKMISEALKEQGYATAAIGKWHVGDHPDLHPPKQGFDHWFGFAGGAMNFWGTPNGPLRTIYRNNDPVDPAELSYLTDDFTEEAIHFIKRHKENPFFIYLAYNAPHAPDHATPQYLKATEHIEYGGRSVYAAMVNGVDHGVGRLVAQLKELNLYDNTILVFLSDNGGRAEHADNRPNRGHKGMLFEGGIKVPFFMVWPEKLQRNQRYSPMVSALDLYPTFIEAAGKKAQTEPQLEGVNLTPFLTEKKEETPHQTLFWRSVGGFKYAVRHKDYKLYKSAYKNRTLLYNLKEDAIERYDLAKEQPEKVAELEALYAVWDAKNRVPGWVDPHPENVIKEEKKLQAIRKRSVHPKKR